MFLPFRSFKDNKENRHYLRIETAVKNNRGDSIWGYANVMKQYIINFLMNGTA